MTDLFNEIIKTPSPCGSEQLMRELIEKNALSHGDKMYSDTLGNLIVRKSGNGKRLMLCANMDQPALIVNYIDEKGRLWFGIIGEIKASYLPGRAVKFLSGVNGIIVCDKDGGDIKDMYIDIGTSDKKSAAELVKVGDAAVISTHVTKLADGKFACSGLNNKIGVLILLEVLKRIVKSNYDTYFVFTVQRNMGNKGVKSAAFNVDPETAIVVSAVGNMELSKGACIKVKDKGVICQSVMVDKLTEIAKSKDIPYQLEVSKDNTSEAGEIYKTGNGVVTGGIGVPAAFDGTGNEIISFADVENAISLLLSFLAS